MDDTTPAPGELSRLVRDAQQAGESYQRLADRAIDPETGDQLSKPYLQKLASGAVTSPPRGPMLRAIAAALRLPPAVVQRAAARQFLDYEATELSGYDDDIRVIVAHLSGMDPTERRKWRAMVEAAEQASQE
ncbi:hypothetical protein [Streptomyces sp. NRRL S-1868]|uniref:hypothetical protein n=1 Tax=Streptomyces sp. NRRL S-1868 TaxID=1463892 RepID=UPI0006903F65|nr:hypothetical protein [Streptomyces sp. NRRL S-1868]